MSSTEFKVGDIVTVKKDMVEGTMYDVLLGKMGTVIEIEHPVVHGFYCKDVPFRNS